MVITQSLGQNWRDLITEADAKAIIQGIEHDNKTIRAALVAKVGGSPTDAAREQALLELRRDNPLLRKGINETLLERVGQLLRNP
jgi:hypothetical protein